MIDFEVNNDFNNRLPDDSYQSSNFPVSKTNNKSDVIVSQIVNDHPPFADVTLIVNDSHLGQTVSAFCQLKTENPVEPSKNVEPSQLESSSEEDDDEFGDFLDKAEMNDESIQLENKKLSEALQSKTHEHLNHVMGENSVSEGEQLIASGSEVILHVEILENPDLKINFEGKQKLIEAFKLELIKNLMKTYLDNIYRGNSKTPLSEDEGLIEQLYNEFQDCGLEHFQKKFVDRINELLESEDLCEIDSKGKRIPLSPQRRAEIREAFAKEVHQAVTAYIQANPTKLESNQKDHANLYIAQDQVVSKREITTPVLNHQEYHQERIELLNKATIISFNILDITGFRIVKHQQEMLKEDMDLSNRIVEMEIKRTNIKRDGVMRDIEHYEVKIESKNKQNEKINSLISSTIRSGSINSDQSGNIVLKSKKTLIGLKDQM